MRGVCVLAAASLREKLFTRLLIMEPCSRVNHKENVPPSSKHFFAENGSHHFPVSITPHFCRGICINIAPKGEIRVPVSRYLHGTWDLWDKQFHFDAGKFADKLSGSAALGVCEVMCTWRNFDVSCLVFAWILVWAIPAFIDYSCSFCLGWLHSL